VAGLGDNALGCVARAGDLAAGSDVAPLQQGDGARHAFVPLPHFSFIGQQSWIRRAEARAPDARDRKHMHLGSGLLGRPANFVAACGIGRPSEARMINLPAKSSSGGGSGAVCQGQRKERNEPIAIVMDRVLLRSY
jgi:hypothetical protein